ncbi:MAG TPA: Sua5/YciO/YrdC/YwlC family protein [Pyrinomonadaceae bacterium]|nr:Sua5/YciO/YrdC/YwlC family protein [Pyrinomonadaceae bacterium]
MRILHPTEIDLAARAIEAGELVVVPTKRWYMLCCDAGNADACSRIYQSKRRPKSKSLLLVLPSKSAADQYFQLSNDARVLIASLWPGDLALRLKWTSAELGRSYEAVGPDIALVGYPNDLLGDLAQRTSVLLAATSANISENSNAEAGPAITVEEVLRFSRDSEIRFSVIVDDGISPQFIHMTIVDCSEVDRPAILIRDGAVHQRALSAALGREVPVFEQPKIR